MKKLYLVSLGCNKNLVDSEIMLGRLKEYEVIDEPQIADVLIVNTCGFIGAAKKESLESIFNLHELRKKGSLLIVTGCFIERYKEDLQKELPEVDLFSGVGDYDKIDELIQTKQSRFSPRVFLQSENERVISGSNSHAFIKLSEGCNQNCSFCAIPQFKGKLNSREIKSVVNEIQNLCDRGFFDFTFIAQDTSSYLRDKKQNDGLIKLIDKVEKIQGIKSARINYLYPSTTSDELIDRIISSNIFHNYFDMPLQHIDDKMLRLMKRGSGEKRLRELLEKMRQAPNSFLRSGFIVGHPKESEEQFLYMYEFIKEFEFDRINAFAYSDEENTTAFLLNDKIPEKIINKRLSKLNKLIEKKFHKSLDKQIGKTTKVLTLAQNSEHDLFIGARALIWGEEIDGEILINDKEINEVKIGQCYKAKITQRVGDKLVATILK